MNITYWRDRHIAIQLSCLLKFKCAYITLFSNVNDEILVADIEEKEKAKKKFREAVNRGQTAATVEAR